MSIKKIILVAFCILISIVGKSSPQFPDYLIFKEDTFPIYNLILEKYFETIVETNRESLFGLKFREGASFNCWRGYQAMYSIKNDSLFLNHILHCGELIGNNSIDLKASSERIANIFDTLGKNDKVYLDWYLGDFSIPDGKLLRWDGVFHKTFDIETLIKVVDGKVESISKISNYMDDPEGVNRRYEDKISDIIFEGLKKIKWRNIDRFDCSESYIITIDESGEICDVVMSEYQTKEEISKFWDRNEYNY